MQRFEGKSLEEALNQAAETFGVERFKLHHAILLEKRGFLGGVKRVVIEAEVNENATPPPPKPAAIVAEVQPAAAALPPRRERAPGGRGGMGGGGPRRDSRGGGGGEGRW